LKKVGFKGVCVFGVFALCIGGMLLSVNCLAFNKSFYMHEFQKYGAGEEVGLSNAELSRVANGMTKYFSGASKTLQIYVTFDNETEPRAFYTQDELLHMRDARVLFITAQVLSYTLTVVGLLILLGLYLLCKRQKKSFKKVFAFGALWGSAAFLVLAVIVSIAALIDFDKAFTAFHKMFFPQGNWAFDYYSNMIRVLPENLFMDSVAIIASTGLFITLSFLVGGLVLTLNKKGQ
jgi:integral membrane protein (TIGR01906 family)